MIRPILKWPHTMLSTVCDPVEDARAPHVTELLTDLTETMKAADGLGLSAPQIGVPLRVCVIVGAIGAHPLPLVNPRIVDRSGVNRQYREGCLSLPGFYANVRRDTWVDVEDARLGRLCLVGTWAHAAQHELEHLDGNVFLQHLSYIMRNEAARRFGGGTRP